MIRTRAPAADRDRSRLPDPARSRPQCAANPDRRLIRMHRMKTILLAAVAVCLAGAVASSAHARSSYDVEIILFENVDVPADPSERWHPRVITPSFDNAVAFDRGTVRGNELDRPPSGFGRLDSSQLRLRGQRAALERSERYRVLGHFGWYQPALDLEQAVSLRINAGEPLRVRVPARDFARLDATLPDSDQVAGDSVDAADDALGDDAFHRFAGPTHEIEVHPLDGTVKLVVTRYVHILTDLYLTLPVEWAESPADLMPGRGDAPELQRDAEITPYGQDHGSSAVAGGPTAPVIATGIDGRPVLSYPVVQQRRMRSGELHHLDHPIMGMLILVSPRRDGN